MSYRPIDEKRDLVVVVDSKYCPKGDDNKPNGAACAQSSDCKSGNGTVFEMTDHILKAAIINRKPTSDTVITAYDPSRVSAKIKVLVHSVNKLLIEHLVEKGISRLVFEYAVADYVVDLGVVMDWVNTRQIGGRLFLRDFNITRFDETYPALPSDFFTKTRNGSSGIEEITASTYTVSGQYMVRISPRASCNEYVRTAVCLCFCQNPFCRKQIWEPTYRLAPFCQNCSSCPVKKL